MSESILVGLACIVVLGVSAQWLASRLGLPSILLLLVFGVVAGPVLGWIDPGKLLAGNDDLLFAVVSLAVALILYEGGLTLKLSELPKVGAVVRNLVTLGAVATWIITALADHTLGELDLGGIGRLMAVTRNDSVNALTVHRFEGIFGKAACFQLVPQEASLRKREHHKHTYGRLRFEKGRTYEDLTGLCRAGFTIKATGLPETFGYAAYRVQHGEDAVPLLLMDEKGNLEVITAGQTVAPKPGDTVIGLVRAAPNDAHGSPA